jgi:hypothetical protein
VRVVRARLGRLQAHAESLMVDHCVITRSTLGALDEGTGRHAQTVTTVYDGCCRVQVRGAVAASSGTVSVPAVVTTADVVEVHIPACASGPLPGDLVTVTRSLDAAAAGRTLAVTSVPTKTFATSRRLLCEDARA